MKLITLMIAAGCMLGSATAFADSENCNNDDADSANNGAGASDAPKKSNFHVEYVNGKPVTVIDTVVSVCGKVPRPSVVYVLTAKDITYEWESLKQDFMPLILATVKKAPF